MKIKNTELQTVNKKILLMVVVISSFFTPFMGAAVNIALPKIGDEFSMSAVSLSWVAMSFILSSATLLVPFGRLADILGRRKLFLLGMIIFTVATLLCGISPSGFFLILFRLLQGLGSALIFSTGMAIVVSAFPVEERGKVIGINTTAVYIGLSAAPFLGGILTQTIGWRSIFFIVAAAGALLIPAIIFKIRAEWADGDGEKFDYRGSVIYTISILSLMCGFSKLPKNYAFVLAAAGIAGFLVFVNIELKAEYPVLNMKLFRHSRVFAFSNLAALINYAATFGVTFILSLYLQNVKGFAPRQAGLILVTQPVVMAITASVSGRMSDRVDSRILSSLGMGIIVAGLTMLVFIDRETSNLYLIPALAILGFGFGMFSSPNTNSVMSSVAKRDLGIASATVGTMRLTGQMISMAIASMAIHIFIGDAKIGESNIPQFMRSVNLIFIVFALLCFIGVFASLARGEKNNQQKSPD